MGKIIDMDQERLERDKPDDEFLRHDEEGRPLYCFIGECEMDDGKSFTVDVWDYDFAGAERKAAAMGNVTIVGVRHSVRSL